jgi:hypothetical protein
MNDDQVDGSSGCYRLVKGLIGQSPVWGRSAEAQRLSGQMSGGRPLPADIANRVSATWGKRPSGLIVPGGMDTEGFQLPPGMEMVEG